MVLLIALFVITLYLYLNLRPQISEPPLDYDYTQIEPVDSIYESIDDTVVVEKEETEEIEEQQEAKEQADQLPPKEKHTETISDRDSVETSCEDTTKTPVDSSVVEQEKVDPCESDTVVLMVHPEPSGGIHYGSVSVTLVANKPSTVKWRLAEEGSEWNVYDGSEIIIDESRTLVYKAEDECGELFAQRREFYEIKPEYYLTLCPSDMIYVTDGEKEFCIDRYAWPNREGVYPVSFVSYYEAMDSCYSAGKRLPTKEEWSLACSGPHQWAYPYGERYQSGLCPTEETRKRTSGSFSQCRGYFGTYDMSGGLAEWTSTRSTENRRFFYVMGGFWESANQSNCFDPRYSYFPQNRHNPVGFRCVQDVKKNDSKKGSRR
ncbi:SUMF1/EgtB/PvdO family nonheme iron enzyme [Chitinispirillales bacterium ANBcel5]|uniref:formylglycine-generating enzyme family protein n=1 Tax=Cellulosispirillum alkaliphilum TaxID=3039283 RepID=UPI002A565597|nr:SUMF1/EgtB/PvdO family nonheme iron enzyme [Chitinispirillales bacterium ANBcel5]